MPSLTYAELAEALKITPASANKLARRRRWSRLMGNDGKARVAVPEDALVRPDVPPRPSPRDNPPDVPPASRPDNPVHILQAQVGRLEGELVGTREALTGAKARADAAEARSAELCADLTAERAKTEKAIEAFSALAERLDALAAVRSRPRWRRLRIVMRGEKEDRPTVVKKRPRDPARMQLRATAMARCVFARSGRDSDMAPGFWRAKRLRLSSAGRQDGGLERSAGRLRRRCASDDSSR